MSDRTAATAALKEALRTRNASTELAEALDVTPQAVCNWASGRGRPSMKHRAALEKRLGIDRTWWLSDDERAAAGLPKRRRAA